MTHKEALRVAFKVSVLKGMRDRRSSLDRMDDAISAYLEARGAVLCTGHATAYLIHDEPELGDYLTRSNPAARNSGMKFTPLHASLQDSPPIIRVEGETQGTSNDA